MGGLTPVAKQKRMLAEVSKRYGVTVGGRVCFRYSACWVSGQRLWGCSLCRGEVPGSYVGWLQRCGVAGLCGNVPAGRICRRPAGIRLFCGVRCSRDRTVVSRVNRVERARDVLNPPLPSRARSRSRSRSNSRSRSRSRSRSPPPRALSPFRRPQARANGDYARQPPRRLLLRNVFLDC